MPTTRNTREAGYVASARPIDAGAIRQLSSVVMEFPLAGQTTSDDLRGYLPPGFTPAYLGLFPSATLGSSTLAVGVQGTAGKYRAAATLTAPSLAPVVAAGRAKLAAQEEVIITIGAASLPGSGSLLVEFLGFYD
jgi:hypothetical protein